MIWAILHADLFENQHPLQFIILGVCVWVDVGWCVSMLVCMYISARLLWWFFIHLQAFMHILCVPWCVCSVWHVNRKKKKSKQKKLALRKLWSIDDRLQAAFINISI